MGVLGGRGAHLALAPVTLCPAAGQLVAHVARVYAATAAMPAAAAVAKGAADRSSPLHSVAARQGQQHNGREVTHAQPSMAALSP